MANLEVTHVAEYVDSKTGETKSRYTNRVGIFFPFKDGRPGGTLIINEGLALGGKLLIQEPKKKDEGP